MVDIVAEEVYNGQSTFNLTDGVLFQDGAALSQETGTTQNFTLSGFAYIERFIFEATVDTTSALSQNEFSTFFEYNVNMPILTFNSTIDLLSDIGTSVRVAGGNVPENGSDTITNFSDGPQNVTIDKYLDTPATITPVFSTDGAFSSGRNSGVVVDGNQTINIDLTIVAVGRSP